MNRLSTRHEPRPRPPMAKSDLDTSWVSAVRPPDLAAIGFAGRSQGLAGFGQEGIALACGTAMHRPRPSQCEPPASQPAMGKTVRCRECGKVYRELDELEDLRDNDSVCLVCNNTIEVAD